jgi:hypothetical protein
MIAELESDAQLEIGHVLFMNMVASSVFCRSSRTSEPCARIRASTSSLPRFDFLDRM